MTETRELRIRPDDVVDDLLREAAADGWHPVEPAALEGSGHDLVVVYTLTRDVRTDQPDS